MSAFLKPSVTAPLAAILATCGTVGFIEWSRRQHDLSMRSLSIADSHFSILIDYVYGDSHRKYVYNSFYVIELH